MANNPTGFPGPPGGLSSSPGGTPGMSGTRGSGPGTPQMNTPPHAPPPMLGSPTKEVNTASLCRVGQESIQDIVNKTGDMFATLKVMQLPNGVNHNMQTFQERKLKMDEFVRQLSASMKRLRFIYDKVNESTAKMESKPLEELLPIEENGEIKGEKPRMTEGMEYATEEQRKLVEQIRIKNRQIKDVIDQFRTIIWEINAMMAMRKP